MVNLTKIPQALEDAEKLPAPKLPRKDRREAKRQMRLAMGLKLLAIKSKIGHGNWIEYVNSGACGEISHSTICTLIREAKASAVIFK